jgi:hypothetical protein
MNDAKRVLANIATVLAISIVGAILMMGVDLGGTRWMKFILYVLFFAIISSPALFSSHLSCSSMLRRLRKRS